MDNFICPNCRIITIEQVSSTETCKKCDSNIVWEKDSGIAGQLIAQLDKTDVCIDHLKTEIRLLEIENRRLRNV